LSVETRESLLEDGLFFVEPDSMQLVSAGICRDWPDARGVFVSAQPGLGVFVNEEEHLRIIATQPNADMCQVFRRLCAAEGSLGAALRAEGADFDCGRLGCVAACPSNVGTGLKATVQLQLARLGEDRKALKDAAAELNLAVRAIDKGTIGRIYEFSSKVCQLTGSAADQVNSLVTGCAAIVQKEKDLEASGPAI